MDKFDFPRLLQLARRGAGFGSARDFAKVLAINENRYSRYERGGSEPSLKLLCRICRSLGTSPNHLLGFADGPMTKPMDAVDDALGGSKRGFSEAKTQSYDPVDKVTKTRVDGLLWEFCRAFLSARMVSDGKAMRRSRSGPAQNLVTIEMVAPLYRRLRSDPVDGLAALVTEPTYSDLPQPKRRELEPLMEAVIGAILSVPPGVTRTPSGSRGTGRLA